MSLGSEILWGLGNKGMFFRKKKEIKPEIFTEETCRACGDKFRRQFDDGDYVYHSGATCKKCASTDTLITAIYGEYPPDKNKDRS